ncbi:MAG: PhnD/SsuA/transferrin family substrate-binding protein [bacterium]
MLNKNIILFAIVGNVLLGYVISAQSHNTGEPHINYSIGFYKSILSGIKVEDAKAVTKLLTNEFMDETNVNASSESIIINGNYEAERLLEKHQLDIIVIPAIDFLQLKSSEPVEPAFVALSDFKPGHEFLILCSKKDKIKSLSDLKGKKLLFNSKYGIDTPMMWLENKLLENNFETPDKFFASITYEENPSQTILPLFFGKASVCVVTKAVYSTMVELNPQLGKDLEILHSSPIYLYGMLCIWSKIDDRGIRGKIEKNIGNLEYTAHGKNLLTLFKISRLVPFEENYLDSLQDLIAKNKKLKSNYKRKK